MARLGLYHNPNCSKSRGALEILGERDAEIEVVEYLKEPLDRDTLADPGFFDPAGVHEVLEQHFQGTIDAGWPIWSLLVFQAWHDRFIESADVASHHTLRT